MAVDFRRTSAFMVVSSARHKLKNTIDEALGRRPKIDVVPANGSLRSLGSRYGCWTFLDVPDLFGATIISCGAGEDISFDLLFATHFGAKVIIVDPTPRAILHVKEVLQKLEDASRAGTLQTTEFYGFSNLSTLSKRSITLVEKAIWKANEKLKLFEPVDPNHVSHSAVDFQNDYRMEGNFIEVEALTYSDLVEEFNLKDVPLLKLDVEGAEVEVLNSLSRSDILPRQICVEYDELLRPGKNAANRVILAHNHLVSLGYHAVHKDSMGVNYLYVLSQ